MSNPRYGPTDIPTTMKSCYNCVHHVSTFIACMRTSSLYHYYCKHPKMAGLANPEGRFIGSNDTTPYWCPYLNQEKKA